MPYKYKEIVKRLRALGFEPMRQNGSHVIWWKLGSSPIPVPKHGGQDISPGVEREIIKRVGLTAKQFKDLK